MSISRKAESITEPDAAPVRRSIGHGCGPCEEQSHLEHRAALEATLFQESGAVDEVVLELEAGRLRFLDRR